MKRILLTILLLAGISAMEAKEKGGYPDYQLSFSWGFPGYEWLEYGDPFFLITDDVPLNYRPPLMSLYHDTSGPVRSTGTFGGQLAISFRKWFTLVFDVAANVTWRNYFDTVTGDRTDSLTGFMIHIMPQARFYWLNRDLVRMYSSVGLGGMTGTDMYSKEFMIWPAAQICPAGIEVGKKVFGFCETGMGTMFTGAKVGIGYRF